MRLYHGTSEKHLEEIKKDGYLYKPYLTNEPNDAVMWSRKTVEMGSDLRGKFADDKPVVLILEVDDEYIRKNCQMDDILLLERFVVPVPENDREEFGDCPEEYWSFAPEDARDYWEKVLEERGEEPIDWALTNIQSIVCDIGNARIPAEAIVEVYRED